MSRQLFISGMLFVMDAPRDEAQIMDSSSSQDDVSAKGERDFISCFLGRRNLEGF
jgi:hypothetical protein